MFKMAIVLVSCRSCILYSVFLFVCSPTGSLQRYVVRAQAEAKLYYMVKEIKSPNGEAEIVCNIDQITQYNCLNNSY